MSRSLASGTSTYRDRRAATIENDDLRVTVLVEGGHIAEILDKRTGINPLWTPAWPSIEPSSFGVNHHDRFGSGADGKLLAGIMANVDLGHFVAAGGDPVTFIKKFNGRISSVHLKDRTTPAHGQKNLPWGTGDTPLREILLTMKRDKHTYPAAIELEYDVPAESDAVKETAKCFAFCKTALASNT